MPTIEIDDKVWSKLQELAIPLVDSPNTALRRILKITENDSDVPLALPGKRRHTHRSGERTPQKAFRNPILAVLLKMGGRGRTNDVLDRVGDEMKDTLNSTDREYLPSGNDIRWRNAVQWERQVLVDEGMLKEGSPRGIWELTDKGRRQANLI
ncbi:MAG: winged helix-turn-helix domain-containing protein [Candidatus Neomarinimicrobiota bacterium]